MTAAERNRRARARAGSACEYCLEPQQSHGLRFPLDHVIPRQHGGPTTLANLALACHRCNLHKGPNLTGFDPLTRKITPLFNPRRQRWSAHFRLDGPRILGKTPVGRATAAVLNMNAPARVQGRQMMIEARQYPSANR